MWRTSFGTQSAEGSQFAARMLTVMLTLRARALTGAGVSQCLDRRVPDGETLKQEIDAWQTKRNQHKTKINWQFGTDLARVKLKRLYPSFE